TPLSFHRRAESIRHSLAAGRSTAPVPSQPADKESPAAPSSPASSRSKSSNSASCLPRLTPSPAIHTRAQPHLAPKSSASRPPDVRDNHVDQLDPDKRRDDSPEPINQQIPLQQRLRPQRTVPHPAQRQRHQRNDNQRVENHRRKHRRMRRLQMHHVQ